MVKTVRFTLQKVLAKANMRRAEAGGLHLGQQVEQGRGEKDPADAVLLDQIGQG